MDAEGADRWLTVEQVAGHLGVADETVRRWIRRGELPVLNVGGGRPDYRIRQADLDQFIESRYGRVGKAAA
jgi:excisionase family DNA binding protein